MCCVRARSCHHPPDLNNEKILAYNFMHFGILCPDKMGAHRNVNKKKVNASFCSVLVICQCQILLAGLCYCSTWIQTSLIATSFGAYTLTLQKDSTKIRRERKEEARKKAVTRLLKQDGKAPAPHILRSTITQAQQKNQKLQSRISKKKERKLMKRLMHCEREANQMETDVPSAPRKPLTTDVEMRTAT